MVANKVDDERRETDAWTFSRLGLGDPIPVSAIHGRGSGDLLDALVAALPPEAAPAPDAPKLFSIAIVGRPNVGKSTLFNRLVGEERTVVHDQPGTTRDAIDTVVDTPDGPLRFVDTAGMRRRSRIDEPTEYYGSGPRPRGRQPGRRRAARHRRVGRCHPPGPAARRTRRRRRHRHRRDLNKWDLLDADPDQRRAVLADVADRLAFLGYAPVLKASGRAAAASDGSSPRSAKPKRRTTGECRPRR